VSIRGRLALVYALALATTLALIGVVVWWQMGRALHSSLETALQTRAAGVLSSLENNGQAGLQESDARAPGVFAALFGADGRLIDASSTAPSGLTPSAGAIELAGHRYLVTVQAASGGQRIVTGADLAGVEKTQAELAGTLVVIGLLLGGVSLAGVWLLAGHAVRPVERLAADAEALRPTDLGRRLRTPRRMDEVGRLTLTLNAMLDRVEESVDRQRLFVAMASHELRTPLAALRVELELAEQDDAPAAELRSALRAASADAVRLTSLSDALLELATATDDTQQLARRRVPLRELAGAALRTARALATAHELSFDAEVAEVQVWVDPRRIELAIANLLANAVVHGGAGSGVSLRAAVAPETPPTLHVEVSDRGPGLSGESGPALFAPFRRGRGTTAPGAGLGLAMVASAVTAHGGTYGAGDRDCGGARFWFTVPCGPPGTLNLIANHGSA
jgi:signal transduction histidine kinase